jgi:hypothetical protein
MIIEKDLHSLLTFLNVRSGRTRKEEDDALA